MSILVQATTGIRWGLRRVRQELVSRPFVRHVGILTVANAAGAVLSFVQGILVARWLGPELYGVAALVMSIPALVYTFFDARSAEASVKYLSEFQARGEHNRALAMCKLGYVVDLGVAILAFLVILLGGEWVAQRIIRRPDVVVLILIYAAAFLPRAFVGTSYALLATLGRFLLIAIINTLTTVLRVALVLGLVLAGWQVAGVVWGNAVAIAATGFVYGAVAYALVRHTWKASWLQGDWQALRGRRREIASFLGYNDLSALLGMIPKQLDVVILGYFRNPTEVGYYKLARSLSGVVAYLVGPLQSVVYPDLARLWGLGDREGLRRRVRRLAWRVGVPLGSAVLLATLFVPFILPPLVGKSYLPATLAAQILIAGSAVWLSFFWLRPMFMVQGEVAAWAVNAAVVAALSVAGFTVVASKWGYLGMAWWWLLIGGVGGHLFMLCYLFFRLRTG